MLIELKNLKTVAALSEETHCYTAVILIDGKPAFHAKNRGHGGCDDYDPIAPYTYADLKRIDEELAKSKPVISSGTRADGSTWELTHSLEIEVGELINNEIARKRLSRMLKSQIVVLVASESGPALATYPKRFAPTAENFAKVRARGETVVNGDSVLIQRALALV
jgi:hypothetical protein